MLTHLFKPKNPSLVGMDIGSKDVKAVLLSETEDGFQIDFAASVSLPKGAVVDREIKDAIAVERAMEKVRDQLPKGTSYGAASVSGSTVMIKEIYMDASLSDDELEAQIEIEADNLIPYPVEEVNIDFQTLRPNAADPTKVDVLLAACRTDNVDTRVDALASAGLESKVIDVEGYALGRSHKMIMNQLPDEAAGHAIAMVDIGASMTTFAVVKDGETEFIREQAFGGEQFTQSILNQYGMTFDAAEEAKITNDLPRNYVFEVLVPFQTQLLQQIRRALKIYSNSSGGEQVQHLVLSGGSARTEGLVDLLSSELGIETIIANPLAGRVRLAPNVEESVNQDICKYIVACGLALRSFEPWHA